MMDDVLREKPQDELNELFTSLVKKAAIVLERINDRHVRVPTPEEVQDMLTTYYTVLMMTGNFDEQHTLVGDNPYDKVVKINQFLQEMKDQDVFKLGRKEIILKNIIL